MATQATYRGGAGRERPTESGSAQRRWRESVSRNVNEERLAYGLGWFSIGLGLAEVAAPKQLAKFIGVKNHSTLIRGLGLREIASGIGVLTNRRPAAFLWSRVAGDAMDLSLLGAALASSKRKRGNALAATAAVAGVTALDVLCSRQLTLSPETGYRAIRVHKAITIDRSPEEIYRFWRDFQNLPQFMKHLESVQVTGDNRSHWRAQAPAGTTVEWSAETTEDVPNERIAWRSLRGSDVYTSGSVHFERAPGGRGTVVRVDMEYDPPGGALGGMVARLFGQEPGQQLDEDLRALKQIMEVGEITRSEASIHRGMHAAQPPADREKTLLPR